MISFTWNFISKLFLRKVTCLKGFHTYINGKVKSKTYFKRNLRQEEWADRSETKRSQLFLTRISLHMILLSSNRTQANEIKDLRKIQRTLLCPDPYFFTWISNQVMLVFNTREKEKFFTTKTTYLAKTWDIWLAE